MITIQEIPQIRPPSISISLAQVSVSPDWQALVCMKFLQDCWDIMQCDGKWALQAVVHLT